MLTLKEAMTTECYIECENPKEREQLMKALFNIGCRKLLGTLDDELYIHSHPSELRYTTLPHGNGRTENEPLYKASQFLQQDDAETIPAREYAVWNTDTPLTVSNDSLTVSSAKSLFAYGAERRDAKDTTVRPFCGISSKSEGWNVTVNTLSKSGEELELCEMAIAAPNGCAWSGNIQDFSAIQTIAKNALACLQSLWLCDNAGQEEANERDECIAELESLLSNFSTGE